MQKNTSQIRRDRLQRVFVGTHSEKIVGRETWHEVGHFIQGFQLRANRITETFGDLHESSSRLGYRISGQCEPAQNTLADYAFYDSVMNGKRNVALLTGQVLKLYRLQYLGAKKWSDNRISLVTDEGYESPMDKVYTRFSGLVWAYERLLVENVQIINGKLTFKQLSKSNSILYDAIDSNIGN